jgi:hypothetical protein
VADNVPITAGSGTTIASDDIGGVQYQRVKPSIGADGAATDAVPVSNGMDVTGAAVQAVGIVGQFDDVSVGTVTENQFAPVRISTRRALLVEGVASGTAVPVSLASAPSTPVTNAGTFPVQVDGAALTALQLIDDSVKADDAGFTVGTDKVSMVGLVAVAHGSNPDAADANDAVSQIANRHRVPFTIGGHPNTVTVKHTTITTAVTDAAIISVSAGTKIVVTAITATLDNASTVFPTLLVGFGAANTPTTTGVILAHGGVPAGGGVSRGDGSGILGIGGDGEDLRVTTTGNATGNGLQIVVTYFTIES